MRVVLSILVYLSCWMQLTIGAQNDSALQQAEDLLISIRLNRGDVLFSDDFFKFKEQFENFKQQGGGALLTEPQTEALHQLLADLTALEAAAKQARPYFSGVLEAREKAIASGAEDFASELFRKAENRLKEAAHQFREESASEVQGNLNTLSNLYLQAEVEAFRNKLLSEVRILVEESKNLGAEKYAPSTFAIVMELLTDVENILKKNQFNDPTLQEKAARLSEESQHLLYLVQLARRLERKDTALEELVLKLENSVKQLAELLDYQPQFSDGIFPVLENIKLSVEELKTENQLLIEKNEALADSLERMREKLAQLDNRLNKQKDLSERIQKLKEKLAGTDIRVMKQNKEVIIRMNGIRFPPGKIYIGDSYQQKLKQIGDALRIFPEFSILVRLGQAAGRSPEYSQSLADQRARAVALFLQTTAFIPDDRIRSQGVILKNSMNSGFAVIDIVVDMKKKFYN